MRSGGSKLRNNSVLRFADVAKEVFFAGGNLARLREKTPVLFLGAGRASTGSLELLEESWPRCRWVDNRLLDLHRGRRSKKFDKAFRAMNKARSENACFRFNRTGSFG